MVKVRGLPFEPPPCNSMSPLIESIKCYYAALLPRRGPHIASHSVCPSVCPSVPLSLPSVTWRHLANYSDTHVLFGTHRGPHIVRPSRPHKLVLCLNNAKLVGLEWVWGSSNLASSGEPPPLLHKTTLTTDAVSLSSRMLHRMVFRFYCVSASACNACRARCCSGIPSVRHIVEL